MTLDEFIQFFADAMQSSILGEEEKALAEHIYIGLALDLFNASQARSNLLYKQFSREFKEAFQDCGKNIPVEFEQELETQLKTVTAHESITPDNFQQMQDLLMAAVEAYQAKNGRQEPLCCHPFNMDNKSTLPNAGTFELCRYVSLETFERFMLFPGQTIAGGKWIPPPNRRIIYDNAWIAKFNNNPTQAKVGQWNIEKKRLSVNLGQPDEVTVHGKRMLVPVFLTPMDKAPHRDTPSKKANHIAVEMGLPDWLKSPANITKSARRNEGVVALRFTPETRDTFFRPTFLDALTNLAFRPGPMEGSSPGDYRHGLTRKCSPKAFYWQKPDVIDAKGRREVVMENRKVDLPSDHLEVDAIIFFK